MDESERWSARTVKLLANLLWFEQAILVAEALSLAVRVGLEPNATRAALGVGPAASRFLELDALALLRGDDMTTFALRRSVEELSEVLERADAHGIDLALAGRVTEIYERALAHYGDVDGELLAGRLTAERLGVAFGESGNQKDLC